MERDEVSVDITSLAAVASDLDDIAAELNRGAFEEFLLGWSDAPASHPDAAAAIRGFGEFAGDQYRDLVALLLALATRIGVAGAGYQETDAASAELLSSSRYGPARPVAPDGATP